MSGIAIVTGSSGGLGSEVCRQLTLDGYTVYGIDEISSSEFSSLRADISVEGYTTLIPKFDTGRVQLVVHCAASQPTAGILDLTGSEFVDTLNVSVNALHELVKVFHSDLKATRGSVIAVSSVHAKATSPKMAAYAAAKAALESWVRSASIELGPEIAVIGLAPGAIDTPKLREGLLRYPPDERQTRLQSLIDRTPSGRIGSSEEIARWICFLGSHLGRFATGSTIVLDGGVTAKLSSE